VAGFVSVFYMIFTGEARSEGVRSEGCIGMEYACIGGGYCEYVGEGDVFACAEGGSAVGVGGVVGAWGDGPGRAASQDGVRREDAAGCAGVFERFAAGGTAALPEVVADRWVFPIAAGEGGGERDFVGPTGAGD